MKGTNMLNKLLASAVVLTAVVSIARPAQAATEFRATITHTQEVSNPPIPNEGSSGVGVFILNDAMTALSYDVTLTGLDLDGNQTPGDPNDNVTRTHFHAAPAGSNGGIVFGQIDPSPTLRNDLDDLVVNPVTGRITGVWDNLEGNGTTLSAQLANLFAGNLYFNVHTTDHGGGEIRGQVLLVPEPSSIALLCCGMAGLVAVAYRRRRAK
jgi:serralysin